MKHSRSCVPNKEGRELYEREREREREERGKGGEGKRERRRGGERVREVFTRLLLMD